MKLVVTAIAAIGVLLLSAPVFGTGPPWDADGLCVEARLRAVERRALMTGILGLFHTYYWSADNWVASEAGRQLKTAVLSLDDDEITQQYMDMISAWDRWMSIWSNEGPDLPEYRQAADDYTASFHLFMGTILAAIAKDSGGETCQFESPPTAGTG